MRWNPEVTVAAIVERDGRFLMVEERIDGRLVLNQPAGHLEDRETLIEAVIRETREETAWRFHPEALVGTYLWRNPDNERTLPALRVLRHRRRPPAEQPLDIGIVRAVWMTHDAVAGAARAPALAAGPALPR